MSGERGYFVTFGIVASSSPSREMLIVDAQLSLEYGRLPAHRAKALNIPLKSSISPTATSIIPGGLQELLRVFLGTPVYASKEAVEKLMVEGAKEDIRPFPDSMGQPTRNIVPEVWNRSTIEIGGEKVHLIPMGQGDTVDITVLDIPFSKGTTFRS